MSKKTQQIRHTILFFTGIILIVACIGGAYFLVRWMGQGAKKAASPPVSLVGLPDNPPSHSVTYAQQLAANGKYAEAVKSINSAIVNANTDSERYQLYIEQGLIYENQQQYASALVAFQQAQAITSDYAAAEAVGRGAQETGNSQLAMQNYRLALQLLNTNDNPNADRVKADLNQRIHDLGGQ